MDYFAVIQDAMPHEWVPQGALLYKIHIAAEDFLEFVNHVHPVEEAPGRVLIQQHQNIYIAVGAEVFAQGGAENGELLHPPFVAEVRDAPAIHGKLQAQGMACPSRRRLRAARIRCSVRIGCHYSRSGGG